MDQSGQHLCNNNNGCLCNCNAAASTDLSYLSSLPPGYRFDPTDQVLILSYLRPKINGEQLPPNLIHDVNIYKHNPDFLAANFPQSDNMWYFFTPRDRKYRNGSRPDRSTGDGYWKLTGADKPIVDNGAIIGFRSILKWFRGGHKESFRTCWAMHEFRVNCESSIGNKRKTNDNDDNRDTSMRLDDFVLCRMYKLKETTMRRKRSETRQQEVEEDAHQTEGQNQGPSHEINAAARHNNDASVNNNEMISDSDLVASDTGSCNNSCNYHGRHANIGVTFSNSDMQAVPSCSRATKYLLPDYDANHVNNFTGTSAPTSFEPQYLRSLDGNHIASTSTTTSVMQRNFSFDDDDYSFINDYDPCTYYLDPAMVASCSDPSTSDYHQGFNHNSSELATTVFMI